MDDQRKKQLAEDITFGIDQTVACSLLDIVGDPHIGGKVQDKLAPQHKGKEIHAYKAEVAGDVSAFFIFMGVQTLFPKLVQTMKRGLRKVLDPLYEFLGRKQLVDWAERHDVEVGSKQFNDKLEEWKDTQSENVAKTAVISTASIATNVAIQHKLGNPRTIAVIAIGKVVGAAVTMGATLAARAFAPRAMHRLEKRINKYVSEPIIDVSTKALGLGKDDMSHVQKLAGDETAGAPSVPAR